MQAAVVLCCEPFSETVAEGALRLWDTPATLYLRPRMVTDAVRPWHLCPFCGKPVRFRLLPDEQKEGVLPW